MRHPICIRCAAKDAVDLARGLLYGWALAWTTARVRPIGLRLELACLYWLCWYWPGYVHPHKSGIECKHGVKPSEKPDTGGKAE